MSRMRMHSGLLPREPWPPRTTRRWVAFIHSLNCYHEWEMSDRSIMQLFVHNVSLTELTLNEFRHCRGKCPCWKKENIVFEILYDFCEFLTGFSSFVIFMCRTAWKICSSGFCCWSIRVAYWQRMWAERVNDSMMGPSVWTLLMTNHRSTPVFMILKCLTRIQRETSRSSVIVNRSI